MSNQQDIRESLRDAAQVKNLFASTEKLKEKGEAALGQLSTSNSKGGIIRIYADSASHWSAHHFTEELVVRFKPGSLYGREDRAPIKARQYTGFHFKHIIDLIESDRFDEKVDTLVVFSATAESKEVNYVVEAAKRKGLAVIAIAPQANQTLLTLATHPFSIPTTSRSHISTLHNLVLHYFCEGFEPEYNSELQGLNQIARLSAELDSRIAASDELISEIAGAKELIEQSSKLGGTIFLIGNGGSTCDANTLVSYLREPGVVATSTEIFDLHSAETILCAYNDNYSPFSRQLEANGSKGDILIAYSTSGNSKNIIDAVTVAKSKGIFTIGLLGKGGGKLAVLCDSSIVVPSDETARVQEAHALIGAVLF